MAEHDDETHCSRCGQPATEAHIATHCTAPPVTGLDRLLRDEGLDDDDDLPRGYLA